MPGSTWPLRYSTSAIWLGIAAGCNVQFVQAMRTPPRKRVGLKLDFHTVSLASYVGYALHVRTAVS